MEDENDESWLYGNSGGKQASEPAGDEKELGNENSVDIAAKTDGDVPDANNAHPLVDEELPPGTEEDSQFQPANEIEDETMQEAFHEEEGDTTMGLEGEDATTNDAKNEDNEDEDSDSDDDDINVVIGDIKSGPTYNIKNRGTIVPGAAPNAAGAKQPAGKFNIEEFESVGTIAGVPAHEFSIDSLEEKPWRKPGADITDYFNYGFNEDTWRAYCDRQKRFRIGESGVGLASLTQHVTQPIPNANAIGGFMPRRGPRFPRNPGHINVIGDNNHQHHHYNNNPQQQQQMPEQDGQPTTPTKQPKENVIQVMTADRREYSRMNRGFGMDDGGPPGGPEQGFYEENQFNYMNQYEPTQDSQAWMGGGNQPWGPPSGLKDLTPGPPMQQQNMPPPGMNPGMGMGPPPGMGMPGMNMPPNAGGGGGMGIPPHMNAPSSQNSSSRNYDNRDRRDMRMDRNNRPMDRMRRSRSPRSRSRDRMRRRSRSFERGSSKRLRSRSRERSKRPRSRSRERSKRPRSRSRDRSKRSKSKDKKKDKSDKSKDSKDKDKDKEKKEKKSHKKDKPEKEKEEKPVAT